ncbi:MAG TPA: DUF2267 domain-containing protein [Pseudomonadales bacterium]
MTLNVAALDRTVLQTQAWLGHISQQMGWEDPEKSYATLRAVLHALRDRLPPDEAVNLAAQLPTLVRGIYFEGWHPADEPLTKRNRAEFLERVRRAAPELTEREARRAVTAVLLELSTELDQREVKRVRQAMPPELRELWPVAPPP